MLLLRFRVAPARDVFCGMFSFDNSDISLGQSLIEDDSIDGKEFRPYIGLISSSNVV